MQTTSLGPGAWAPAGARKALAVERRFAIQRWFVAGAAIGMFGISLPAAIVLILYAGPRDLVGLIAVYGSLAVAAAGGTLGASIGRARMQRVASAGAQRTLDRVARTKLTAAADGVLRVRGRIRPLDVVVSITGVPCLAFEERGSEYAGEVHVRTGGGSFEIDDGSGLRAIVRARHVTVIAGVRFGDELVIPLEGEVEIVGRAHACAASDDSQLVGLRTAARAIELEGTAADPLIVRLLGPLAVDRGSAAPGRPTHSRPSSSAR